MVLLQFLFLFQTLPIVVPEKYFRNCNRIISHFIWNNKKQRIQFKIVCKPKEEGGLGVPNIHLFPGYTTPRNNEMDRKGNRNQMD